MSEQDERASGYDEAFESEPDVVVDSAHWKLVADELVALGAQAGRTEHAPELGLTRLTGIPGLTDVALKLRDEYADALSALSSVKPPRGKDFEDIDVLLVALRTRIGARFGNWVPELGKNRNVRTVLGFPNPRGMGLEDPTPVTADRAAWEPNGAGADITVGVLDTRLYRHPSFDGLVVAADTDTFPDVAAGHVHNEMEGHATFVTDLIRRQASAASVVVRAVLDPETRGATAWDTAKGIAFFASRPVDILNLSLGSHTADGIPPLVIRRAIERVQPTTLVVAAAGNHLPYEVGVQPPRSDFLEYTSGIAASWPAALPDVIAVGAYHAPFSPRVPWVTCLADGVDAVAAFLSGTVSVRAARELTFDGYAQWSGTSFATPVVSGAIAARMTEPGVAAARRAFHDLLNENTVVREPTWPA